MPSQRSTSCPACGGALPRHALRCDICGEDLATAQKGRAAPPGRHRAIVTMNLWQAVLAAILIFAAGASTYYLVRTLSDSQRGKAAMLAGAMSEETAEAIQALDARVAADPADAESLLQLANALHDAREYGRAVERYRAYLLQHPDDADAQVDMGICLFEMQRYDDAIAAMEDAVKRHPEHVQGHYNLGIVCMNAGKKTDAIAWFEKTLALNPGESIRSASQQFLSELRRSTK